jgi:hypothetical protein
VSAIVAAMSKATQLVEHLGVQGTPAVVEVRLSPSTPEQPVKGVFATVPQMPKLD